ncbi:hypothetical protein SFUMM280S_01391 [Streptomyces fumanus]
MAEAVRDAVVRAVAADAAPAPDAPAAGEDIELADRMPEATAPARTRPL